MVEALQAIRKKPRITKEDALWVGRYFKILKQLYSNKELSELTGWNEERIKKHTRGVQTVGKPSTRPIEEVSKFVASGLSAEQAKRVNSMLETLDLHDVSVDDVAALIAEARHFGMDIKSTVSAVRDAKEAGISIGELAQISNYNKSLDKMGINEKRLGEIFQLISKQGDGKFDNVAEFIKTFPSLQALQNEVKRIALQKDAMQTEVKSLQLEVSTQKNERQEIQRALDLYGQLEGKGYNQDILDKVLESSKRFGEPNQVLDAINLYRELTALKQDLEKLRTDVKIEKVGIDRLKADHLRFQYLLDMLDKLSQRGFNIQATERLYAAAQKYGDPIDVLRAIDGYGSLSAIEGAAEKANNYDKVVKERDEAISRNRQLEAKTVDYEEVKRARDDALSKLTDLKENSIKVLRQIIDELELPKDQRRYQKELIDSAIPELVERSIEDAVTKRLRHASNEVFLTRFRDEVRKQVQGYLRLWPTNDFGKQTLEKVKKLQQKELADPFVALKGKWSFHCSRCGLDSNHILELKGVYDIKEILTKENVSVPTVTPFGYAGGYHSIPVSLSDIVKMYLKKRED